MIRTAIVLTALLGAAGCNVVSEEDQLENAIREGLSNQGTVQEVNLTRQDENNINGYVAMQDTTGRQGRLNCTAQRTEGSNFSWRCAPAIDESVLRDMEGQIRERLSQQADVVGVDLQRAGDDNHMSGQATVRDGTGAEIQVPCTAERTEGANFNWRCGEGEGAESAPADSGAK